MKLKRKASIILVIIMIIISSVSFAVKETKEIILDGKLDDWTDKPEYKNYSEYISSVKYHIQDDYLYLYVERSERKNIKSDWGFNMIIIGKNKNDIQSISVKCIETDKKDKVVVEDDKGVVMEGHYAHTKGKWLEFGIPLSRYNLDKLDEIKFKLVSDDGSDAKIIIITNGPTFWQSSTIVMIMIVMYRYFKTQKKIDI